MYLVGGRNLDGYRMLGAKAAEVVRSVMPGVEVVHLTDMDSAPIKGVSAVKRLEKNCPMAVHRMRHHQAEGEWLFIDIDVLVVKDVTDVFESQFDIALSSRSDTDQVQYEFGTAMPYNMGVVFSRSPAFWKAVETELLTYSSQLQEWMGDQLAVCRLVDAPEHDVLVLDGNIYNCTPESKVDLSKPSILHFKGDRKEQMMAYQKRKAA